MKAKFFVYGLCLYLILPSVTLANTLHPARPLEETAPSVRIESDSGTKEQPTIQNFYQLPEQHAPAQDSPLQQALPTQQPVTDQTPQNMESEPADKPQDASQQPDTESELSLASVGEQLRQGPYFSIPSDARNTDFLAGTWNFDHAFVDTRGQNVEMRLTLDHDGFGTAIIEDAGQSIWRARAISEVIDDTLSIRTSNFFRQGSKQQFLAQSINCLNSDNGVQCVGTDGSRIWSGQNIVANKVKTDEHTAPAGEQEPPEIAPEKDNGKNPDNVDDHEDNILEILPGKTSLSSETDKNMSVVRVPKDGKILQAMTGETLYAHDFVRKQDGEELVLGFQLEENGRGTSTIRDKTGNVAKAIATARDMPDGSVQVQTEPYKNEQGGEYYPTFMSCRQDENGELHCNLTNGRTYIYDGRLLGKKKEDSINDILTEVATPEHGEELALPQQGEDISFMEGTWRCNVGLCNDRTREPVVVSFTFDKNGKGSGFVTEKSGIKFSGSANATYENGILRVRYGKFHSKSTPGEYYEAGTIECSDNNGKAFCSGKSGDTHWTGVTFSRQK